MKIIISLLVLTILILTGATGYYIYGINGQQNELTFSEQEPVAESKVTLPIAESVQEASEVSEVSEVSEASEATTDTTATEASLPEEKNIDSLEDIADHELISVEKYSTIKTNNYFKTNEIFVFDGKGSKRIYANSDDIFVKAGTLRKLIQVDNQLKKNGYNLVIWIGYRDEILQQQLREHLEITMGISEGRYDLVAPPGQSQHQKGTSVDVTLERIDGASLEMPSAYLDFTDNRLPSLHKNNEALIVLQEAMVANEMQVYKGEWWHFNDTNKEYVENQEKRNN